MDNRSKWIWKSDLSGKDIYCDFVDSFDYSDGKVSVKISADSNYALYINGTFVESGQYGDYPHYKIYDEFDITKYCKAGKNVVAITVWHYGQVTLCYCPGSPALRYEIWNEENMLCASGKNTLCRENREYESGLCRFITTQLGYSFHYDCTAYDGWREGNPEGFECASVVEQELPLYKRPIKKLQLLEKREVTALKAEGGTHFLYDIGEEEVGYLTLKVRSDKKQKILITYGEHIHKGSVSRIIAERDFSVEVTVGEGESVYTNPYRRLGLRYLEVFCESPIEPEYITVIPTLYPLKKEIPNFENPLDRKIYEVCVRTLELCMHEHYEDCPWREQSLYCMDSRNQMLCGYYCFEEYEYPRANLKLISQDRREDGLLSICYPSKNYGTANGLVIPSFSLHYYTQMWEYITATGDVSLAKEVYPKLLSVIKVFTDNMKDGCVDSVVSDDCWNFYEWSDGLTGTIGKDDKYAHEACLNLLLVIALRNMAKISQAVGEEDNFTYLISPLKSAIREEFFDKERGYFINSSVNNGVSELVNSLAILADVCTADEAKHITRALVDENSGLTPITLSMLCFKYEALIKIGGEEYKNYILDNIREKYKMMLDQGATTFWETEDLTPAASLCHGWSALPVYYYEIFGGAKPVSAL